MKANELMIGDWVVYEGDVDYDNPVRIEGMDIATKSLITSDREDVGFDGIEPIPLTAEILEKNGFTRFGTGYILKGEHLGLDNPSNPSNYLDNYWLRISIKAVNIKYVHQLQHALRLCGIEKEIKL